MGDAKQRTNAEIIRDLKKQLAGETKARAEMQRRAEDGEVRAAVAEQALRNAVFEHGRRLHAVTAERDTLMSTLQMLGAFAEGAFPDGRAG